MVAIPSTVVVAAAVAFLKVEKEDMGLAQEGAVPLDQAVAEGAMEETLTKMAILASSREAAAARRDRVATAGVTVLADWFS